MKKEWKNVVFTHVKVAVFVAPNAGKSLHENRPFHGFVLNDENGIKDYYFSNGEVLHTEGGDFFYLPKNSSYRVKTVQKGACYAINFEAEIEDSPFCIKPKNYDALKKSFRTACDEWGMHESTSHAAAMRALYDAIYLMQTEQLQSYMPSNRQSLIVPALEKLRVDFTNCELTVAELASLCGMSEVYFRKIFVNSVGISPKEYLIRKRMEYAKQLLLLGELEISEIAGLCGYGEPCHFSREFKKRFGVSPGVFQGRFYKKR